jgi:N-acetylglucosamine kinase-like BadF-type ATPase
VLGVDGGQSGIRMRHSSGERVVEVAGVSRQEGDVVASVAVAIAEAWREAAFDAVERVVLGLTTAPVDPAACDRLCGRIGAATSARDVWLADDAVTSHAGALSLGWGVSLVAGTGVACLAVPDGGEPRIVGGHGYLLGDEGGAFWIGSRGVRAALQSVDGRGASTTLKDAAERSFGPLPDLHVRLHDAARPVDTIARFAPEVMVEAVAGDAVAGAILDQAAHELVSVARAGAAVAGDGDVVVPLALGGRLLASGTELRRRVDERLARELVHVATRTADASPLDGAIKLGQSDDPGPYHALVHTWTQGATA